jgi:methionyl-tRNA formyltransferase
MRILLFGMRCHFTPPVLAALIASEHEVVGVVLPGKQSGRGWRWLRTPGALRGLPLGGEQTVDSLANNHKISLAEWHPGQPESAIGAIAALQPDLIVVACFPRLISRSIIDLATYGGCNVHPSLLPALRGPDPIFWTLQQGLSGSGVTLHRLSDRFDTGEILAQRGVEIVAGERIDRLETVMGQVAGVLLLDSLTQWPELDAGAHAQNERGATYAPAPKVSDFRIPTDWPVERAYRFIRGVSPLGQEIEIFDASGQIWRVRDAERWLSFGEAQPLENGDSTRISIPFTDGILRVIPGETVRWNPS